MFYHFHYEGKLIKNIEFPFQLHLYAKAIGKMELTVSVIKSGMESYHNKSAGKPHKVWSCSLEIDLLTFARSLGNSKYQYYI